MSTVIMVRSSVLLFVLVVVLMTSVLTSGSNTCPSSCTCRWKDGKESVECHRGMLGALPDSIDPDTQVLDLSHSRLQRLPPNAFADAKLVHLQKLVMRSCELHLVDAQAFLQLTNLVTLDLSDNKLRVLPDAALRHTVALRELDLHGNLISHIPAELPTELTKLDLSRCRITTINLRAFMKLRRLEHLRLDHNRLQVFQTVLVKSLYNLHGIELHGNPWVCDCRLRAMHYWLRNVSHPTSPSCAKPPRLEGKLFKDIDLNSFACLPQVLETGKKAHGRAGSNITAWCPVAGLPTPAVSWFLGDVPIYNATKVGAATAYIVNEMSEERGSLLLLVGPVMKDSGSILRCVATNAAGAATASFILKVDFNPSLLALSSEQMFGIIAAVVLGVLLSGCVCVCVVKRRSALSDKTNGNLHLTFPNGGGSVVAARTPDEIQDEFESDDQDDQKDYNTLTRLAPNRAGSLVTTLIDTEGDESDELLHRTPQRPLTGVWPAQALALLDSAAPEHVMYSTMGRGTTRHSLLPDFAPDYSNSWSCHFSTLPRSQRQDVHQQYQRSYTPTENSILSPPSYMLSSVSIPAPCPPPPPLSPSVCLAPPPPMQTLYTKLSRITVRDSPDEGYQEGTDV